MAYLLDYIKSRWAPKGSVVTAGVPPEARVEQVPVTRELVVRHLAASTRLSQGETQKTSIFMALSDPLFLQTGPRALAQQLIAAGFGAELEPLVKLLTVLTQEVTRRMYIDAASQRRGSHRHSSVSASRHRDPVIQALCTPMPMDWAQASILLTRCRTIPRPGSHVLSTSASSRRISRQTPFRYNLPPCQVPRRLSAARLNGKLVQYQCCPRNGKRVWACHHCHCAKCMGRRRAKSCEPGYRPVRPSETSRGGDVAGNVLCALCAFAPACFLRCFLSSAASGDPCEFEESSCTHVLP